MTGWWIIGSLGEASFLPPALLWGCSAFHFCELVSGGWRVLAASRRVVGFGNSGGGRILVWGYQGRDER